MDDREQLVQRYFAAMRQGAAAEDELLALFAEDAVYEEPFSGSPRRSEGIVAIRSALREGWEFPLPDLKLTVRRIDLDGDVVRSQWICESPALDGPIHGHDRYTIRDGLIARLEVFLDEA